MSPPIFKVCAANAAVKSLLGSSEIRLYPFGEAPQGVKYPYSTWQSIGGSPENYLGQAPDIDLFTTQIDVWAKTAASAKAAAEALRDAIEPHAHITSWGGSDRDPETKSYRYNFTVDWHVPR